MADSRAIALRAIAQPSPSTPSATGYRAAGLRSLIEAITEAEATGETQPGVIYSGTLDDRMGQIYNGWLNRWYSRTKGVATGYRTKGRRRSENVIDARENVPGETREQRAARLWAAHDRGVRLTQNMVPTINSRNAKTEGRVMEPVFIQGGDVLVPTASDMAKIMEGAVAEDRAKRKKKPDAAD